MEVTINLTTLFTIASGTTACIGLLVMLYKQLPTTKMKAEIDRINGLLDKDNQHLKELDSQVKEINVTIYKMQNSNDDERYILLKNVQLLIKNALGIANKEDLKNADDELNEFLLK